ncbi:restriction endonuclease subunit S [Selenomonas sputigena]|uniref:restriction endonuclease subunit S n=1 Tax=Selenomonas sputigena TaxID=69823 RepID=UPI0022328622|nr:restriction endonuclease subunit S [Selenomonas sputigena]UZD42244.1 restriction endonuclease subunit S [Selenomonas sputigena]
MSDWKTKTLGEVTSYIAKGIPPKYVEEVTDDTISVLNQKCNRNFRISYDDSRLHNNAAKKVPDVKMLKLGDVLINSTGTGTAGRVAQIWDIPVPTTLDGHMILMRPTDEIEPLYYGYAIKAFQAAIESYAEGSTGQTEINKTRLQNETLITYPVDKGEQSKIARILAALDEKILLNEEVNKNLQEQAQAIYTDTFITNADPSWSAGVLSDIAEITMGQSPKGNTYNENGNGTVFFQGRAEFGFRFPTRRLYTTDPKRMSQANDVLLSVRAPVGDLNVAYEPCCIGRGLGAIHSKDSHQSFVLYTMFALRQKLDMFNGEGTVFGSINRDALNSMELLIPPTELMDRFEETVAPMDATIRNNYEEICRLESIRDSLLPRLMSGELDVSDIDL